MTHWTVDDLDPSCFEPGAVDPDLVYVVRTTCLLESRADLYGAYLEQVLPAEHHGTVKQWASEESCHGAALRAWLARADPGFDADAALERYLELPYHDGSRGSIRGGPAEELMARCVVEALAAGYYRALRDAASEPLLKRVCARLMSDEARHFKMFLTLLRQCPPIRRHRRVGVMLSRAFELDDDQITYAAHVANHRGPYRRGAVHREYAGRLYPLYRDEHVEFVQAMVWRAVGADPGPVARRAIARAVVAAVGLRGVAASALG